MRIISGELKGRNIKYLKNINTRPLKDLVRENIFNILNHSKLIKVKLENSKILDLYSGIGSFGIECISRGAKKVIFIEQDAKASDILRENLINLSIFDKSIIYKNKIENILNNDMVEKFNIVFLDPPFKKFDYLEDLKIIKKKKIV
jgi:16S rRNA (guanine966-N2)-methyltransferase